MYLEVSYLCTIKMFGINVALNWWVILRQYEQYSLTMQINIWVVTNKSYKIVEDEEL